MQPDITLSFRHIERSGALADRARTLGLRLERFSERIMRCHMTLEGPGNSHGGGYVVKIDLTVPGAQIHADSLHVDGAGHNDIHLALRDAFNSAKRQLQRLHGDRCAASHRTAGACSDPLCQPLFESGASDE